MRKSQDFQWSALLIGRTQDASRVSGRSAKQYVGALLSGIERDHKVVNQRPPSKAQPAKAVRSHDRIHAGSQLAVRSRGPVVTNLSIHNTLRGESSAGCWRFVPLCFQRNTVNRIVGNRAMSEAAEQVHRIRLIGPWEWAPAPVVDDPSWRKVRLPDEWVNLPELPDGAAFRRRFHCPTGIESGDRVFVVISTQGTLNEVLLNRHQLERDPRDQQASDAHSFEITSILEEHNLLEISVPRIEPGRPELGLGLPVVLEIVTSRG